MTLQFCSCHMCRIGRKRYGNPWKITHLKRSFRRQVKIWLKKLPYEMLDEIPTKISVPYTD